MLRLAEYLERLEQNVTEQGGKVIWAENGREAIDFILKLALEKGIQKLVKSKSMVARKSS